MSDGSLSNNSLELKLLDLLEKEREKSHQLTQILLKQQGLLDEKIIIAESDKPIGKIPWELQKNLLEKRYSRESEIISEV